MSYYHNHQHTGPRAFKSASAPQTYGAVVGTVETDTEKEIVGRCGEHLQFYVQVHAGLQIQVDVNIQSMDGSEIQVYVGGESLTPANGNPDEPFGSPAYGIFQDGVGLSYAGLGLTNNMFEAVSSQRVQQQLEAALNQAEFVSIYGMMFDDGGADGKGIHETHYDPGKGSNKDGAVAVYHRDSGNNPQRTWFFFKFDKDNIGS